MCARWKVSWPTGLSVVIPAASSWAVPLTKLMLGLPMKSAVYRFTGLSYSSRGGATCTSSPLRNRAILVDMVKASTWSWVT